MRPITRICRACDTPFETTIDRKEYCTLRCRDAEKRRRRKAKERELAPEHEQHDVRFFACVTNPTVGQLTEYSKLMLLEMTQNKPIQFFGEIPYFTTPSGIVLAEQFGVEPKQWIMQRAEPANDLSSIDVLLGKV